jgi:hypothetical protein
MTNFCLRTGFRGCSCMMVINCEDWYWALQMDWRDLHGYELEYQDVYVVH